MAKSFISDEEMMQFEASGEASVGEPKQFIPDSEADSFFGTEKPESEPINIGGAKPQYEGALKSLVKDPIKQLLVKPAIRTAQALVGAGTQLFGSEKTKQKAQEVLNRDVNIRVPILGDYHIEGLGGKDLKDAGVYKEVAGDAFKTAAYLYSGGRIPNALGSLVKGKILKSAITTGAAGTVGGGAYGAGQSFEDQKDNLFSSGKLTYDTLFGAVTGLLGGMVLGGGGATTAKAFRGLVKGTELFTEAGRSKFITDKYRSILNLPQRTANLEARAGKDTASFLAREFPDAEFKLNENGRLDTSEVVTQVGSKYQAEEQAFEALLESEARTVNLQEWKRNAITKAEKNFKGTDQDRAISKIEAEADAYGRQYFKEGWENAQGEQIIPLDQFNEIKRDLWSKTNFKKEADALFRDTNYLMGNTAMDLIETSVDDINIRAFNKRLGDYAQAMKVLSQRNNGVVKGGRMGRYFARVVGATIGTQAGGIGGGVVGAVTADEIAKLMMNPQITLGAIRKLLKNVPVAERDIILRQAQEIIEQRGKMMQTVPKLPPPSFTPLGPETRANSIRIAEAAKGEPGRSPESGQFFGTFKSTPKGGEAFGAVGGLEIDDEGKVHFNPTKAAAGVALMAGRGKIKSFGKFSFQEADKIVSALNQLLSKDIKIKKGKNPIFEELSDMELLDKLKKDMIEGSAINEKNLEAAHSLLDTYRPDLIPTKLEVKGVKDARYTKDAQGKFTGSKSAEQVFKGFPDLTTKVLDRLKGKSVTSKQEILDFTNMPELKQAERDLIRNIVNDFDDKVPVKEFANKVKTELLPLRGGDAGNRYEGIALSDDLRGPVASYKERVYESPIKTSAGEVHYGTDSGKSGYFAHSRIEDLPNNLSAERLREAKKTGWPEDMTDSIHREKGNTRRVIELQSDLFQKGRLEAENGGKMHIPLTDAERTKIAKSGGTMEQRNAQTKAIQDARAKEFTKLEPYRNTWHERIIREEVKQAALDGKTKLQFPTGETAMKIEGLGETSQWAIKRFPADYKAGGSFDIEKLTPEKLKVGERVWQGELGQGRDWIITDVLGDGKFKAVPKNILDDSGEFKIDFEGLSGDDLDLAKGAQETIDRYTETFDISGKIDTQNPIYKFYEKEVARYLKNKYGAELITDPQGVKWMEVKIKKEMAKLPVEAFGVVPFLMEGEDD